MAHVRIVQPRVSYADLERAPEDGLRYELYDGEVFVVPAPLPRHQVVQHLIADMLRDFAANHGGFAVASPIDIVFSDYDVLQPDVVFFSATRAHLVNLDRVIRTPPDLCVEVISPSTQDRDRGRKMQMFARFGVPEYWIVDPRARRIEVYGLEQGSYALLADVSGEGVIESPTIAGLAFSVAGSFRRNEFGRTSLRRASLASALVVDPDRLDVDELADAVGPELAAVAGILDAAKRQPRV
jgi:Uma2 family endonuclease